MLKRKRFNSRKAKKKFSRTADRTHRFNLGRPPIMRGGIRM